MKLQSVKSWKSVSELELNRVAAELRDKVSKQAFILLDGVVGAGKTTFAKSFCPDETSSPTYSVLTESGDVLHGDFYRLKDSSEITQLELGLYLEDKNYFLLEWGREHLEYISKEIPYHFEVFVLEISINSEDQSRNFELLKLI